jgi:DNA-binding transcriptional MocR family regulator
MKIQTLDRDLGARELPRTYPNAVVDFTRSIPPRPAELGAGLKATLLALPLASDVDDLLSGSWPGGTKTDREAGARFLSRRFGTMVDPGRVIVTNGTQSALQLLFRAIVGNGGLLLSEAMSYGVLKGIADRSNVRLAGVELDREGVIPHAVASQLRSHARGAPALYCNPTIHNPTTATMSLERRIELAALAREYGFSIIEDDVLGMLHPEAPPPIAAVAPDVTWYVMGLTKCLAHGIRVAYLVAPTVEDANRLLQAERTFSSWFPAPLQAAVVRQWFSDGTGERITSAIRAEMDARHDIVQTLMAGHDYKGIRGAMHIWLNLPGHWSNHRFEAAAKRGGVLVRTAEHFAVDNSFSVPAVRISLSSPPNKQAMIDGITTLAGLLESGRES